VSLILIVADSVRNDALGCTRSSSSAPSELATWPVTPTVDRIAAEGAVFERVITAAPWTVPSLAAMLTGVYAHRLGLVKWEQPWPADHASLFDLGRRAGCEVASFVFDPEHLFSRVPAARVGGSSQDSAALLRWLDDHRGTPFLLFIHYWWTHIPYLAEPMTQSAWRLLTDQVLAAVRASQAARAGVQRLYAHAVEWFSEQWLPRLLASADLDRCWVAITADHGESWGERTPDCPPADVFDLHGNALHEEVLRIPWIVRPPGGMAPRRIAELVRSVDLMPTLAALLGWNDVRGEADLDGVDLSGVLRGEASVPRLDAVSVRNHDFLTRPELPREPEDLYGAFALTTDCWRQIWEPASGRRMAFDLCHDPGETRDVGNSGAQELERGWQRLREELDRARVGEWPEQNAAELRARLESWGYVE
jgi:arylsulfatase A-like enzyme